MYDSLKPKTMLKEEAKTLVALAKSGVVKILPQKCCVLLIKGPVDNEFLMGLARKYKDSSWIAPRQNEITFKFLLDASTRDFFKGVAIFTQKTLIEKFAGKIYTSGITFIRRREKDRMLKGLSYIRAGDVNLYLSTSLDDTEIESLVEKISNEVKQAINEGFIIWTNSHPTTAGLLIGDYCASVKDGKYTIRNTKTDHDYLATSNLFDFLYNINVLHQRCVENEPAGDETYALGA